MSNNEPDYKDNLFFNPQTEWKGTALDALGKEHTRFSYRLLQSKIEENAKLKEEVSRESYKVSEAYCYIEELKELLRKCQNILKEQNFYRNTPVETDTTYRTRCLKKEELLKRIDEVLK